MTKSLTLLLSPSQPPSVSVCNGCILVIICCSQSSHPKKSNNREQKLEYESKLEQIVSAVKEGFKSQSDFLSNTLKGTDQDTPANQIQQTIMHQTQQTPNTQSTPGNQAQVAIMRQMKQMPIWYPQSYPQVHQFMQPTNSFQMNHLLRFNIQPNKYTTNITRQKLPCLTDI